MQQGTMNNFNDKTNNDLGHSPDALAQRKAELLALLAQTAPELISDQQLNVDKLKALLGDERIAGDEHYELSWAGKSAARREIQKTSSHTLRPDANNPAQAQHMLIEGENLEVLRVLQKSYHGKVKMIYIDPPYNTGSDSFVYPDNYSETLDEYQRRTGEKNEAGYLNKQSLWKKNSKESGQYHSAWLSMMYPRLYLARNLLRDDGVIFISIDDNEAANLKLLCDEVFGSDSFGAQLIWLKGREGGNDSTGFGCHHEYIFCYVKNSHVGLKDMALDEKDTSRHIDTLPEKNRVKVGAEIYKDGELFQLINLSKQKDYRVKIPLEDGTLIEWDSYCPQSTIDSYVESSKLFVGVRGVPYVKSFLSDERAGTKPSTVIDSNIGTTKAGGIALREFFGQTKIFSYPKPPSLIRRLSQIITKENEIVLDFFSGSGTTAHAVMTLNAEDGGSRQSISVQMPEVLAVDSEAYKAGYHTIADITRARIAKVIEKLKAEHPDKTGDLACAHFTLAPSNFKVWRGDVNDAEALREQLAMFQSAEKTGQKQQADAQSAMLAELLLKHGLGALGVHAIAKPRQVAGTTVHRVLMADDKHMWLCFDPYTAELKDEIVRAMPAQVVMLNSCFVGTNADEQLSNLQLELAGLDIGLTVI
jgi:adenine-specific DNA-methyltransferase